jgi:hypothetical protein
MSYRPQFAFRRSSCYEQKCMYSFDRTNLPALKLNTPDIAAGAQTGRIPLHLDKDAAFELRGISVQYDVVNSLAFRLEDPDGNPLCDSENQAPQTNFVESSESAFTKGAGIVALEGGPGGIPTPASANYVLYLYGLGGAVTPEGIAINLHGVKLYREERCQ